PSAVRLQEKDQPMKLILKLQLWVPFIFSVLLSGIAINATMLSKASLSPGLIPFLCFLPMTFLFVATSISAYVSGLEKRLDALESHLEMSPREKRLSTMKSELGMFDL